MAIYELDIESMGGTPSPVGYPFSVIVEAKDIDEASVKTLTEYPGHKINSIMEKSRIAMIIK